MRTIQLIVLIPFTLLIIYDFFPNLTEVVKFPAQNLKLVFIFLLVVSLILPNAKRKKDSHKVNFYPFLYFFVLFFVLTLLGGESQSGLVDPYSIGIFIFLLILELIKYVKIKKEEGKTFISYRE